jgi:hypothetical protein
MTHSTKGANVMSRITLKTKVLPRRNGAMDAEIVLVHLPDNNATPYVTWQRNSADGATYWGHYFATLDKALADFEARP